MNSVIILAEYAWKYYWIDERYIYMKENGFCQK